MPKMQNFCLYTMLIVAKTFIWLREDLFYPFLKNYSHNNIKTLKISAGHKLIMNKMILLI